jgi:hypothetical protein
MKRAKHVEDDDDLVKLAQTISSVDAKLTIFDVLRENLMSACPNRFMCRAAEVAANNLECPYQLPDYLPAKQCKDLLRYFRTLTCVKSDAPWDEDDEDCDDDDDRDDEWPIELLLVTLLNEPWACVDYVVVRNVFFLTSLIADRESVYIQAARATDPFGYIVRFMATNNPPLVCTYLLGAKLKEAFLTKDDMKAEAWIRAVKCEPHTVDELKRQLEVAGPDARAKYEKWL